MAFIVPKGKRTFLTSGVLVHPQPGRPIDFFCRVIGAGGGGEGHDGGLGTWTAGQGGDSSVTDGVTTLTAKGGIGGDSAGALRASRVRPWWTQNLDTAEFKIRNAAPYAQPQMYWSPSVYPYGRGGLPNLSLDTYSYYSIKSAGEHGEEKQQVITATGDLTIVVGDAGLAYASASYPGDDGSGGYVYIEW